MAIVSFGAEQSQALCVWRGLGCWSLPCWSSVRWDLRLLPAPSALYASDRAQGEASSSQVFRVLTQADSWVEKEEPAPSN